MYVERCLLQMPLRLQALVATRQGLQFFSVSGQWKPLGATVSIPNNVYTNREEKEEQFDFDENKHERNFMHKKLKLVNAALVCLQKKRTNFKGNTGISKKGFMLK